MTTAVIAPIAATTTPRTTADGVVLQLYGGPAPARPVRGTVLVVHGLGEHAGRYAHVLAHLAAHGWATLAYDQRGHGRSGGPRGGIPANDSLLTDLAQMVDHARTTRPGPLVLLGHSLGGLLVGRFVAEGLAPQPASWWRVVDGLVMSSPALDPGMSAGQQALLAVAAPLLPGLALGNGLQPAWVCSDPVVVAAYVADALVHNRVTPRLARWLVDAGVLVRQRAPAWRLPTLLLYAGADRCVAPRGSAAFATAAPSACVASQRYDRMAHEIFNEPGRAQVLAAITHWLAVAPLPASQEPA